MSERVGVRPPCHSCLGRLGRQDTGDTHTRCLRKLFGEGRIDVLNLGSGFTRVDVNAFQAGNQSIPAIGVNILMDYFRQ